MGSCQSCFNLLSTKSNQSLPVDTPFIMSSSVPSSPSGGGGGFGKGSIDLGGLEVRQVSTFTKIWSAPGDGGASIFFPSSIPAGFSALGAYAQPNKNRFFGRVLVARDIDGDGAAAALTVPTDFTLTWYSSDGGYFWLPVAPSGYHPVGYLVTTSLEKPSPESLRCVRDDFTDQCEEGEVELWSSDENGGISIHELVPTTRGLRAPALPPGTFIIRTARGKGSGGPCPVRCLKNQNFSLAAAMPDLSQINDIIKAYAPVIYFHPNETYLPSSVNWFFDNGSLLYSNADPTNPARIDSGGANLPQGGTNDGAYWLDLPAGDDKDRVKKGELSTAKAYVHVKQMLGGTATDLMFWFFYPFNGPASLKVRFLTIGLGKIGEHVGDWEHLTVRVSNFDGALRKVYFSEHSRGEWVELPELEFNGEGGSKPVAYSALNGHAFYPKPGLVLQGSEEVGIGIRNDARKGKKTMDSGERFEVVAAEHLSDDEVVVPAWVEYMREWGPKVKYQVGEELEKLESLLPEKWRKAVRKLVDGLPPELLGVEGPTGPKVKASWEGDEA